MLSPISVPGDLSSLSFPLVAALITRSRLTINHIDMSDPQGDKAMIEILQSMGAKITINANDNAVTIHPTHRLESIDIDINHCIDCLPILAVVACFAKGTTHISGATIARQKESDRISAMAIELTKMGADIDELPDGLLIRHCQLHAATVDSHHDHRIAMALAVAAMATTGNTQVNQVECVNKTFPHFAETMMNIGANIRVVDSGKAL